MFKWILKLFPASYKWEIGVKKVAHIVAKLVVSGLVAVGLGDKVSPEHLMQMETAIATVVIGLLEWVHDFLKLKFPESKWL